MRPGTSRIASDYAVSGVLTFARGETSKSILVPVRGDQLVEPNEQFFVNLTGAKNVKIADGQGTITILNNPDYTRRINISGASVWGGDPDTKLMHFTVSLAAA